MKKFVFKIAVLVMAFGIAESSKAGPGSTGGGDPREVEFVSIGRLVLNQLEKSYPRGMPTIDLVQLKNTIETIRPRVTDEILMVDGRVVAAMNDREARDIKFNRSEWDRKIDFRLRKALVLHEYLSVDGVAEEDIYKVSVWLTQEHSVEETLADLAYDIHLDAMNASYTADTFIVNRSKVCYAIAQIETKSHTLYSTASKNKVAEGLSATISEKGNSLKTYCGLPEDSFFSASPVKKGDAKALIARLNEIKFYSQDLWERLGFNEDEVSSLYLNWYVSDVNDILADILNQVQRKNQNQ